MILFSIHLTFSPRDFFPSYTGAYCDPIEAKEFILDMFQTAGGRRQR